MSFFFFSWLSLCWWDADLFSRVTFWCYLCWIMYDGNQQVFWEPHDKKFEFMMILWISNLFYDNWDVFRGFHKLRSGKTGRGLIAMFFLWNFSGFALRSGEDYQKPWEISIRNIWMYPNHDIENLNYAISTYRKQFYKKISNSNIQVPRYSNL